jgi:hypothetical protein
MPRREVRRAVASGRSGERYRLEPPSGDVVLEGVIDFPYETPEGYEIVDHKTDAIRGDEVESRMARYQGQEEADTELVRAIGISTNRGVRIVPTLDSALSDQLVDSEVEIGS